MKIYIEYEYYLLEILFIGFYNYFKRHVIIIII